MSQELYQHLKRRRRKYRIHYGRIFLAVLICATIATGAIAVIDLFIFPQDRINFRMEIPSTMVTAQIKGSICYNDNLRAKKMATIIGDIYSKNALLIERETGKVLYRKASDEQTYPASLTKIMTALLAVENLPDLDERITLDQDMYQTLYQKNASMAGFQPQDQPTVEDLLYGTMLPSGAECAVGLARRISGSEENFAVLMNEKAAELGMQNTHFTNCTGLHDEDHWTTADDMGILLRYALQNETFRTVFQSATYTSSRTTCYPSGLQMSSLLFRKLASPGISDGKLLGGKTGYTGQAGLCLASEAEVNGDDYILITMGANGDNYTQPFHILDAVSIYEHIPEYEQTAD